MPYTISEKDYLFKDGHSVRCPSCGGQIKYFFTPGNGNGYTLRCMNTFCDFTSHAVTDF